MFRWINRTRYFRIMQEFSIIRGFLMASKEQLDEMKAKLTRLEKEVEQNETFKSNLKTSV